MINPVLINRTLKGMQNGIETNTSFNGFKRLFLKFPEQSFLIKIMKAIHDLVGKAYKTIDIANWRTQIFMQHAYGGSKRSTVSPGYDAATFFAGSMKQLYHADRFVESDK